MEQPSKDGRSSAGPMVIGRNKQAMTACAVTRSYILLTTDMYLQNGRMREREKSTMENHFNLSRK